MPRWPKDIAEQVVSDIRYGLRFKVGTRSRRATDQEIEVVARTIVEAAAGQLGDRARTASRDGGTPSAYSSEKDE